MSSLKRLKTLWICSKKKKRFAFLESSKLQKSVEKNAELAVLIKSEKCAAKRLAIFSLHRGSLYSKALINFDMIKKF